MEKWIWQYKGVCLELLTHPLILYFFSIFFNSFSNLLRYISPAMVKPNGKAIQMPSKPMPHGKPRVYPKGNEMTK